MSSFPFIRFCASTSQFPAPSDTLTLWTGTNTYLVTANSYKLSKDKPSPSILIDTGEGIDGYTPLLEKVLRGDDPENASGRKFISDM